MAAAISAMEVAGLQLPILAKPRLAGCHGSHELALVRDLAGLQSLVRAVGNTSIRISQRICRPSARPPPHAGACGVEQGVCHRRSKHMHCSQRVMPPSRRSVQVFETEDSGLRLPVVLQQYIPHGGILTKVCLVSLFLGV
jgi:hypothetical protein